jgi:hypothetical protein
MIFLAALRHDRITAPCVIDGPINGRSFLATWRRIGELLHSFLPQECATTSQTQDMLHRK